MLFVLDDSNISAHAEMMDDVYLFRHKLFVERLGWEGCRKPDGREIDDFDGPGKYPYRPHGWQRDHRLFAPSPLDPAASSIDRVPAPRHARGAFRVGYLGSGPAAAYCPSAASGGVTPSTSPPARSSPPSRKVAARRGFDGLLAQTHPDADQSAHVLRMGRRPARTADNIRGPFGNGGLCAPASPTPSR